MFYHTAFWRLSTERAVGMSLGAIPYSKILEYGREIGLVSDMLVLFETVIREMDSAYLSWASTQQSRAKKHNQQDIPIGRGKTKKSKRA